MTLLPGQDQEKAEASLPVPRWPAFVSESREELVDHGQS
jgi:hypothetical protein